MGLYFYGYVIGFASGILVLKWCQLGNEKIEDGVEVEMYGCFIVPRRNVDGTLTVYVQHKDGKESCFFYPMIETDTLTINKLEKLVKRHLKEGNNETAKETNC